LAARQKDSLSLFQPIFRVVTALPAFKVVYAEQKVVVSHRGASGFNQRTAQPTRAASISLPSRTRVWKSSISASGDASRPDRRHM